MKPHLTEKSLALAAKGYYTFLVPPRTRKEEIKSEVKRAYNVHVREIRTIAQPPKTRRVGRRMRTVAVPAGKKAIVRLAPGETIEVFETTKEEEKKHEEK